MLSRVNRLKNTKDIKRIFREGKSLTEGFLFLKTAKSGLEVTRFALIVSQKISKKAARRNEIKRRLRGAIKNLLPQIKTGFDVVIVVREGMENRNFPEIEKNTEKLFKKADII